MAKPKALSSTFKRGGYRKNKLSAPPRIKVEPRAKPRKSFAKAQRFAVTKGRTLFTGKNDRFASMRPTSVVPPR